MGKSKKKQTKFVKCDPNNLPTKPASQKPDNKNCKHNKNSTNDNSTSTEEFPPMPPTSDTTLESSADISTFSSTTKGDESTDGSLKLFEPIDESTLADISSGTDKEDNSNYVENESIQNVSVNSRSSGSRYNDRKDTKYADSMKGNSGKGATGRTDAKTWEHRGDRSNGSPNVQGGFPKTNVWNNGRSPQNFNTQSEKRRNTGNPENSTRYNKNNDRTYQGRNYNDRYGNNYKKSAPHHEQSVYLHTAEAQGSPDFTKNDSTDINKGNNWEENQSRDDPNLNTEYVSNPQGNFPKTSYWSDGRSAQNSNTQFQRRSNTSNPGYSGNYNKNNERTSQGRNFKDRHENNYKRSAPYHEAHLHTPEAQDSPDKFKNDSTGTNKGDNGADNANSWKDSSWEAEECINKQLHISTKNQSNNSWDETENNLGTSRLEQTPNTSDDHFDNSFPQKSKSTQNWRSDRKSSPIMPPHGENTSKRYSEGSRDESKRGSSRGWQNRNSNDRYSGSADPEYKAFCNEKGRDKVEFVRVEEIQQDLFAMPKDYSLGHCVAEDMRMGSGIAVSFKRDFKHIGDLLEQKQKQGGLAVLEDVTKEGTRYIYYLVTKRESTGKPTYEKFWSSLQKMRDHIREHDVKKLAIPRLGCGLDRLDWERVKLMLEFLFKDVDVKITVCNFQQAEDSPEKPYNNTCKVVNVAKSIADIEEYTTIVYLSSEDGHVSADMEKLETKFSFLSDFRRAKKLLGDVVRFECKTKVYLLYGCIVRKSNKDPFNFASFAKCISQINKNNRKDVYEYVGIQALKDDDDDLLMEKILTILKNCLNKVDVYVCWEGDLVYRMPIPREP